MSTPACSIDTDVGAQAWPSGLQVWNGNSAPRTPKPMKVMGKNMYCVAVGMQLSAAISCMFMVVAPLPKYIPRIPISRNAEPPMSISVSFIAEYSLSPLPHTPMSRYMGMSAVS